MMRRLSTVVGVVVLAGALTGAAFAQGGGGSGGVGTGGGGGVKPVLPTPAIAPGTFDRIGAGPVYVHESFGHAQGTRYAQNGSIVDVTSKPDINGIRAEYPNNKAETWFGTTTAGAASW